MEVAKIFSQPPLIAYKRDTNRDMLLWYKLWPPITHTPGTTPCNQDKCKTFPFICTSLEFQGPNCSMNVNKPFNCHTYNIVYVIRCTKCTKLYIGETGHTLNTHFKEQQTLSTTATGINLLPAIWPRLVTPFITSVLRDFGSYSLTMPETGRIWSLTWLETRGNKWKTL